MDELKCALCPRTAPVEDVVADGWDPSFYVDEDGLDTGTPICWECAEIKCDRDAQDGLPILKPEFIHLVRE